MEPLIWDNVWPVDLPGELELGNTWESLDRFRHAGFHVQSITLAGDNHNSAQALKLVAWARREIRMRADRLLLVEAVEDIARARQSGRLAVLLHFEGTRCFERNPDLVEAFFRLGVRHTIVAFNMANSAGGGCADPEDRGLTAYGRKLIREMERVGMVVDLSHTGRRTSLDVIEMAEKPVLFTHSNVDTLRPAFRNLTDEQIRGCARTGGVIGVSGSSEYLGDPACDTATLFRHLDHMVQIVGARHVGLGLDCVFKTEWLNDWARGRPEEWPMTADPAWPGFTYVKPEQLGELRETMARSGYSEANVAAILGGNLLRIYSEAWA